MNVISFFSILAERTRHPSSHRDSEVITLRNSFQGGRSAFEISMDEIFMSSIYELLESRAKEAEQYIRRSKGAKLILKIAGAVRLNITTVDPTDHAAATITGKETVVSQELLENPHATITGKNDVIKELIKSTRETDITTSAQSFENAEKRGEASIESHGIKGRLIVSRVRKMLLG